MASSIAAGKEGQGKSKVIGRLAPASALQGRRWGGFTVVRTGRNEQETGAKITARDQLTKLSFQDRFVVLFRSHLKTVLLFKLIY